MWTSRQIPPQPPQRSIPHLERKTIKLGEQWTLHSVMVCFYYYYKRTYHSIRIFLLKSWKGWEYKAQCRDDHKEAGHDCYNLEIFYSHSPRALTGYCVFTLAAQEWWGFSNKFQRCLCVLEKKPVPKSSSVSSWDIVVSCHWSCLVVCLYFCGK